jgi:hypothetical protein
MPQRKTGKLSSLCIVSAYTEMWEGRKAVACRCAVATDVITYSLVDSLTNHRQLAESLPYIRNNFTSWSSKVISKCYGVAIPDLQ